MKLLIFSIWVQKSRKNLTTPKELINNHVMPTYKKKITQKFNDPYKSEQDVRNLASINYSSKNRKGTPNNISMELVM